MSHRIIAAIASKPIAEEIAAQGASPHVASLIETLSMAGFNDQQLKLLAGSDSNDCIDGFEYLGRGLKHRLIEVSASGSVVYLNTDYFGGIGAQAAAVFRERELIYHKHDNLETPITRDSPINTALRELGVIAEAGIDELDTVGLFRFRSLANFKRR